MPEKTTITDAADEPPCARVPMKRVGPARLAGPEVEGQYKLPLATYESPLWPSVARGARVSRLCGGIRAVVLGECMTRSVLFEADGAIEIRDALETIDALRSDLEKAAASTSRFARLTGLHSQVVGNLLFLRMSFTTGDAAGHNMATKAAEAVMQHILAHCSALRYGSISGNLCADKKSSAVNGLLGRGRSVVAEMTIPGEVCRHQLRADPAQLAALCLRKNWIGSNLAGGVRTANAHAANMLLAFYLATGQDAANIVEGSQAFTHAELRGDDLYFSVSLPNLILGTAGTGKAFDFVRHNLKALDCLADREPGANARRLAVFAAAAVWCGECSLLAAQTNPGELVAAHMKIERRSPRS
jgi:hydroxymethylglutaryl-CoA reductase (NADPH)